MTEIKKNNTYSKLASMDIGKYIEQKGNFDYLPWSDAHDLMKQIDPDSKVEVREFKHHEIISDGQSSFLIEKELNYQSTKNGAYVHVFVTVNGKTEDEMHPVLDFKNQPINDPKTTDVNKSLKRAFVKALAKHGLGLYIYRGEDLPQPMHVENKEIDAIYQLLETVKKLSGEEYLPTLLENVNAFTKEKGLIADEVAKVEDFTLEQAGIAKRMINKKTQQIETELKEKA